MEQEFTRADDLTQDQPLKFNSLLAERIGLNEAIVIQQFYSWCEYYGEIKDEHKWIRKGYNELNERFPFWSINTLKRTICSLQESEYLISKRYNSSKFDNTKWYRVNVEKLLMTI